MPKHSRKPSEKRRGRSSCPSQLTRRSFLGGVGASTLTGGMLGCGQHGGSAGPSSRQVFSNQGRVQSTVGPTKGKLVLPGPFPGRVVEVGHEGSVRAGIRNAEAVQTMVSRGMQELVPGAETAVDAWRYFFQPGDRVGVKVVPVGMVLKPGYHHGSEGVIVDLERPGSISSYEVVDEVVKGLVSAGVRLSDIMMFERYRKQFIQAGYLARLPEGVHWECCSSQVDESQLEIDGQLRGQPRQKNIAGYDRDVFRELPFCQPTHIHDPMDGRRFRSHLTKIVTQKVDKIISIPVLKDHRSAGVTMALKNMSHGFVNNVARSHVSIPANGSRGNSMNHCQTFIPAAVSLPPMREKCVLQIMDGLVGTYEGGPGSWCGTFATWEYKSLFFATDPVALDHVGWEILDAKRSLIGWPLVSRMGLDSETGVMPHIVDGQGAPVGEAFHIRQPQHVPLAGLLGLGTFSKEAIDHTRLQIS